MKFYVYILEAERTHRFYIGYSEAPDRRLFEHNAGKVKSTRPYRPWKKVYQEQFLTEAQAMERERELKSKKSRLFILKLIGRHVPIQNRDG
jgi:putative endonuclease